MSRALILVLAMVIGSPMAFADLEISQIQKDYLLLKQKLGSQASDSEKVSAIQKFDDQLGKDIKAYLINANDEKNKDKKETLLSAGDFKSASNIYSRNRAFVLLQTENGKITRGSCMDARAHIFGHVANNEEESFDVPPDLNSDLKILKKICK